MELLIPGQQEVSNVSNALLELVKAHPLLRSGFVAIDGLPWSFATVVWKQLSQDQIHEVTELHPSLEIDSQHALLRPCRFSFTPCDGGVRFLVEIHHALFDQWAMDIFRSDLSAILHGRGYKQPGSFKSVSEYYISSQDTAESASAIDFWQDHLREVTPTALPLLRHDKASDTLMRTDWHNFTISTADVKSRSSIIGCSAPAIFQSAMAYLLGSYAGMADVTLGSVFSGRTIPVPDVETVFGPCLATLPFRMDLSTVATGKDLLQAVTDRNRAMQTHVVTSPTFIRKAAGIAPGVKLFDSLFIWQESTVPEASGRIEVTDTSADRLEFGLVLEFEPSPTIVKVRATYRQSLITEEQISAMLHQLQALSSHLMDTPNSSVDTLGSCLGRDLLSIAERNPASRDGTAKPDARLTVVLDPEADFHILPTGAYGEIATSIDDVDGETPDPAKIIEHPEHGRLRRSGNTGRMLSDRTLIVVGKRDDQVKISGHRIDLSEINAALAQNSNVAECATAVVTEQESAPVIVSFWTPASRDRSRDRGSDNKVAVSEAEAGMVSAMLDELEDTLQPHMVPTTLLPLNRLPKTPGGRPDKQHLQDFFGDLQSEQRELFTRSHETVDGPISSQEHIVADCLAETLDIPFTSISRSATFSSLGVTLQNKTSLVKSLESHLNGQVDASKLSAESSIAQLCRTLAVSGNSSAKKALSRSEGSATADGSLSSEEQIIADALAEILDIPAKRITSNASFFSLGLNSLNAIQLVRSLKKRSNVELGVGTILSRPSLAKLSRTLAESQDDRVEKPQGVNVREVIQGDFTKDIENSFAADGHIVEAILPCTPLQQAMLSETSGANGDAYCNTLKLNGFPNITKLKECWAEMSRRHGVLRTCFVETPLAAHPFAQVLLKDQPSTWASFGDESRINGTNGDSDHEASATISPQVPMRLEERGSDLYLVMHHALYDGISLSSMFSEMVRIYNGERLPSPVSFEPFLQVVLAQNGQQAIKFWSKQMEKFTPHPLPALEASSIQQEEKTISRKLPLVSTALKTFNERHSCTSSVVFQAAWVKTLSCLQDVKDVCFGNVVSGRNVNVADVEQLIAPCFNTIPLRTELDKLRTNMNLIGQLQDINVQTLPHQLTALGRIQGLTLQPSLHLFDSLLLVQPPTIDSDNVFTEEGKMDMGIPIVVEVIPDQDEFEMKIHFLANRVPESTIPAIMDAFQAALASCVRYPSSSLEHFMDFDSSAIAGKLKASPVAAETNGPRDDSDKSSDAAWSTEEQIVCDVFSDLAGVDPSKISKTTSLYRIGLDSLNAVQVASRLRSKGFNVDAADVMQHQTAKALAAFVTSQKAGPDADSAPVQEFDFGKFDEEHRQHILRTTEISEEVLEAVRPCTAAQSGMLSQFIQSAGKHYLNHTVYKVPAGQSFATIESAWVSVQQKHQVLRMGFFELDEATVPFAMAIYQPGSSMDRIVSLSATEDYDELKRQAGQDMLRALHLPAWRVALIESRGKREMCLSMHHALYDADSLEVLLGDFAAALDSTDIGPVTSIDQTLRTQIQGAMDQRNESEVFWRSTLGSAQ
jgi:non-ribosomal peptide synthetase component F/acyl carrier protein